MLSRLQVYCESIMEAAWLAAVVVIPLFFNVSSVQTFEPDKVFVLRFLAIISGAAFLLKRLAAGNPQKQPAAPDLPLESLLRHPLVLSVTALAVLYTLSSIFSIMPAMSWLGMYQRAQGTVTFYCYGILFFVVLGELRTSAQLRRLQYAFIVGSLPAAGYGILQYFGADPLPWSNPMKDRSSGSMGNPIFLGAYLAMVVPLTFGRFVDAVRMLRADNSRRPGRVLAVVCGAALALQGLALLFTQSRGPVIGLGVSVYVCLFLLLVLKRAPGVSRPLFPVLAAGSGILAPVLFFAILRLASLAGGDIGLAGLGAAIAVIAAGYWMMWRRDWGRNWLWLSWLVQTIVFAAILSFVPARIAADSLKGSPLSRLAQMSGNSVDVRQHLWETAVNALRSGSPSGMPANARDSFPALRPVIGYGPENIWFIAGRYATPELVRLHTGESVDRMHDETFDNLITLGTAGAVAWLVLLASAVYCALRLLGFRGAGGWRNPFIPFCAVGIIAGALLPWVAGRAYLMGVGVIAGLLAGAVAFAAWSGFRNPPGGFAGDGRQLIAFCILGSVIAHFVETAVGIAVTPTRAIFSILIGVLAALSIRDWSQGEQKAKPRVPKAAERLQNPLPIPVLISSFAVLVLGWAFLLNRSNESSALELFRQAWLAGYSGLQSRLPVPGSLILLLLTIAGSIGLIYGEDSVRAPRERSFAKTAALSAGLLICVWLAVALLSCVFWTATDASSPNGFSIEAELRIVFFLAALFLLMLAAARRLSAPDPARHENPVPAGMRPVFFGVPVALCALGAIHALVLQPARADAACRAAHIYEASANPSAAIRLYARASELAPRVVQYWISKGLAQASAVNARAARPEDAIQTLRHAVELNPLAAGTLRVLASVCVQTAERSADPGVRSGLIRTAISLYEQAARLVPNYPDAYCELGRCSFLLGDQRTAAALYEKSLQMNPYYARTHMFMGELHYRMKNLDLAYQDFRMAARLNRGNLDARKNMGFILALMGRKEEAIRTDLEVLERDPQDVVVLCRLAALYFSLGDSDSGNAYARRAYDRTPSAKRGTYEQFAADLQHP